MKFLPHFDAKLEYLVHRLDLQPDGASLPHVDENANKGNVRPLDDFRSPKDSRARRVGGKSSG